MFNQSPHSISLLSKPVDLYTSHIINHNVLRDNILNHKQNSTLKTLILFLILVNLKAEIHLLLSLFLVHGHGFDIHKQLQSHSALQLANVPHQFQE